MVLSPIEFLDKIKSGISEKELNKKKDVIFFQNEINELIRNGHAIESAKDHLSTDYSDGFTICKKCGSYYHLGKGFTKHLSNGCLICEGEEKHRVYWVEKSEPRYGGFPARYMSVAFDDGMSYCKDKIEKHKFKTEVNF